MRVRTTTKDLVDLKVDLGVCFLFEGETRPSGIGSGSLARTIAADLKADSFKGRAGDWVLTCPCEGAGPRKVVVVGLGEKKKADSGSLRAAASRACRAAIDLRAKKVAMQLPARSDADDLRAAVEGASHGAYLYQRHLTDERRRRTEIADVSFCSDVRGAAALARRAEAAAAGVALARDLVNEPASRMDPTIFANRARATARTSGLSCRVLGPSELEKQGLTAMLAVARGSARPSRLVHLTYKPKKKARGELRRVVIVGKGVTFDSGGLDLKPAPFMLGMKADMGGAAAVVGAMSALAALDCPVEVHGLCGLVENMTGGDAYKPGDILDTYKGKTVEVGNTDAEGRLVLCDVMAWAVDKLKPTEMVDLATLTGAIVVALGPSCIGMFSRDEKLGERLLDAAEAGGEKMWAMPLFDEYLAQMQKGPADLCNVGQRYGGAITAALFLGEFVPRELPWAHLDIAGPAYTDNEAPDLAQGGTGSGVMSLLRWLER